MQIIRKIARYKFHDYFQAFNIGFLNEFSLALAILLCTAEFIAGFSVLTGFRFKYGIWIIMIFMGLFTPLTFVLALTNPVSDCGCFGDAIHLTNWQTFWKNIILISLAIISFTGRSLFRQFFNTSKEWLIISITILLFILFTVMNLIYLPVIDFLPYKTGVRIADKMVVPEGVPVDEYETTFIYEKNGIQEEFSLSNYPADDTAWKFVDQKSVIIKKGYQPPIHDFIITTKDNVDITARILSDPAYSLLMIVKNLGDAGSKKLSDGFETGKYCIENGINFYVLTASGTSEINEYDNGLQICTADETTLKTIVRSSPGYLLLKDGIIVGKWSWANIPKNEWFLAETIKNPVVRPVLND